MRKQYYEVIATYRDADLNVKRELYLIKAETCSDAEYILMHYMQAFVNSTVLSVKLTQISEVHESEIPTEHDKWFKCKASMIIMGENGKKKRVPHYYAIKADATDRANNRLLRLLVDSIEDWEINSVSETKIVEYIESFEWADASVLKKTLEETNTTMTVK